MNASAKHWDTIYQETDDSHLGWYEADAAPMMRLLGQVSGWEQSRIFLPGAGTSVLVDHLLDAGARLILNDLSSSALSALKQRLGERSRGVEWICGDSADPLGAEVRPVNLWIDRAVLHFLVDADAIEGYFNNLKTMLTVGGYALFAEFPPDGARMCAGLELHPYSVAELHERLGDGFELVDSFDFTYVNPEGGSRPYIYALFRRDA